MRNIKIAKSKINLLSVLFIILMPASIVSAQEQALEMKNEAQLKQTDSDNDGLLDFDEMNVYRTNPENSDTDGDGFTDGEEIKYNYDPNKNAEDKLYKIIGISLKNQSLTYSLGPYEIKTIKISSGLPRTPTPKGEFTILKKPAFVTYRGRDYFYPNTRWNMLFKQGSWGGFYIHGAYWHNNFGKPMSHGCVNVSYTDMEPLYNWTDEGTRVIIE